MILTEEQQKYQPYQQVKLMEQPITTYPPLGKAFEKNSQGSKQKANKSK